MKTHTKLIKKRAGILQEFFIRAIQSCSDQVPHPSIRPSIYPCVARESYGLTLFSLYTFPLKIIQFIPLFNYSDCWYRGPLAALENNADKNALNLSAKGNTIRIIDGCKKCGKRKDVSAHIWFSGALNDVVLFKRDGKETRQRVDCKIVQCAIIIILIRRDEKYI